MLNIVFVLVKSKTAKVPYILIKSKWTVKLFSSVSFIIKFYGITNINKQFLVEICDSVKFS